MGSGCEDGTFISPFVKYILFFFNFICWMFGGVMVGVGIWSLMEKNKYYQKDIMTVYDIFTDMSIIVIVFGIIVFLIGSAGCIGALRENILLLKIYYYSMIFIFMVIVVGAVLAFVFKDKLKSFLTDLLKEDIIITYHDEPDRQAVIDWIQEKFECCGVDSYTDWNKNEYFNCSGNLMTNTLRCSVPHSCCKVQDNINSGVTNILCGRDVLSKSGDISLIYTPGCIDATLQLIEQELPLVAGLVIGFAVPVLLGIFLARLLEGQIMEQKARWQYRH